MDYSWTTTQPHMIKKTIHFDNKLRCDKTRS
jgi:hypothetical protein